MRDRRTTVLIVLLVGAWALGCGDSSNDDSSGGGEGATTTTADAPPADISKSVVAVEGIYPDKQTKVTGVVYDAKQGLVLTANHAMEAAPSIDVRLADGTLTHARPVARAQCHDLAVVKLFPRPPSLEAIKIANSDEAKIGEPVATMTYLFGSEPDDKPALTRVAGSLSSLDVRVTWTPLPAVGPLLAHQTSLSAAASGSPLLNEKGEMIGFNTLVDHPSVPDSIGIEYAFPSNYVKQRMDELKPGSGGALGGWESEHNDCHAALRKLIGKGHIHDPGATAAK
jgi:S1-C subfamily serine protease